MLSVGHKMPALLNFTVLSGVGGRVGERESKSVKKQCAILCWAVISVFILL